MQYKLWQNIFWKFQFLHPGPNQTWLLISVNVSPSADLVPLSTFYFLSKLKISSLSVRMNSTIWFWYTMLTAMFPASSSGHISVGPNTIPMPWVDIRFFLEKARTLQKENANVNMSFKLANKASNSVLCATHPEFINTTLSDGAFLIVWTSDQITFIDTAHVSENLVCKLHKQQRCAKYKKHKIQAKYMDRNVRIITCF